MTDTFTDISLNLVSTSPKINVFTERNKKHKNSKNTFPADNSPDLSSNISPKDDGFVRKGKVDRKLKTRKKNLANEEEDEGIDVEEKKTYGHGMGKSTSLFANNPDIPMFAHRVIHPVREPVFSSDKFEDLDIHPYTVSNLKQNLGLEKLTTVQQKSIPVVLSGRDALIRSQTGSGKTLAYALPIVEALQRVRPKVCRADGIRAVVVVPTRELALQSYEVFIKLVKSFTWLVPGCFVGGEKRKSEKARLRKGINILVGTPGRLLDHVQKTESFRLDNVEWLVLDEADRLLDMGYEQEVASFVSALDNQHNSKQPSLKDHSEYETDPESDPKPLVTTTRSRQTLLLSATLTSAVERLAGLTLKDPVFVDAAVDEDYSERKSNTQIPTTEPSLVIPESLSQFYVLTPAKLRLVTLATFIIWKCQFTVERKMLIFCATQDMVDFHTELLSSILGASNKQVDNYEDDDSDEDEDDSLVDVEFFKLHGNMTQKERTDVFKTFRSADSGVLLCTDVASRGLDLPSVDWIVQYTAPCSTSDYVHRVGRTARVGSHGSALLFLAPGEAEFVRNLENRTVRLREQKMESILENLHAYSDHENIAKHGRNAAPFRLEEAATALQLRFETAVMGQQALHNLACKAYVSWVRFYASYPKEVREVFCFKALHMGHYAKSFALRDPPKHIAGIGKRQGLAEKKLNSYRVKGPRLARDPGGPPKNSKKAREVSEYGSGLEPAKKKRRGANVDS